jgi:DnaJ family protein A protein 5
MMEEEDELFDDDSKSEQSEETNDNAEEEEPDDESSDKEEIENNVVEGARAESEVSNVTNGVANVTLDSSRKSISDNDSDGEDDEDIDQLLIAKLAQKRRKGRRRNISIDDMVPEGDEALNDSKVPILVDGSEEELAKKDKSDKKKKKKLKKLQGKVMQPQEEQTVEFDSDQNRNASETDASRSTAQPAYCIVCKSHFKSRSQLFKHIKATGHAAPLDVVKGKTEVDKSIPKPKKKKGKS